MQPSDLPVIYVVDSDESVRRALTRLMRAAGFDVRPYATSQEFLAEVTSATAGCIVLDIGMSRFLHSDVQAELHRRGIALPVVAVSASDNGEVRERARLLGARFFLCKPVDDRALLDAIAWVTTPSAPAVDRL